MSGLTNGQILRATGEDTAESVSATALTALCNVFTASLKGMVPAPGTATGKVLSDAGTWITLPAGSFSGDASEIVTGTLTDARLSANVPLKAAANVFALVQTLNGGINLPDTGSIYVDGLFGVQPRILLTSTAYFYDHTGAAVFTYDNAGIAPATAAAFTLGTAAAPWVSVYGNDIVLVEGGAFPNGIKDSATIIRLTAPSGQATTLYDEQASPFIRALNYVVTLGENAATLNIGNAGGVTLAFFGAAGSQQVSTGGTFVNNVTAGGEPGQIDDWTIVNYATDADAIRNAIYQLAARMKLVDDAIKGYGLTTT